MLSPYQLGRNEMQMGFSTLASKNWFPALGWSINNNNLRRLTIIRAVEGKESEIELAKKKSIVQYSVNSIATMTRTTIRIILFCVYTLAIFITFANSSTTEEQEGKL